jgi:glycosyltransferase involved in cell wall biosynthesis
VIPAYNAADYVGETLESVFAQEYEPFEVVVVDDGSEDRTGEIARSFAEVRCMRQANAGAAAARNAAVAASRGELIAPVDADDLVPPWKLRVQVEFLRRNPEVACVMGRQEWLNPPPWLSRDAVYGDLDGIPLTSALFRRYDFERLGGYDPARRTAEDTDLLIRMREAGLRFAVIPDVVLYRRFRADSLTGSLGESETATPLIASLRGKLERERRAGTQ